MARRNTYMLDGQIQTCNRSELQSLKQGVLSEARPQLCEDGGSEKIPVETPFKNSPKSGGKNDCLTPPKKGLKSPLVHITKSIHTFCPSDTLSSLVDTGFLSEKFRREKIPLTAFGVDVFSDRFFLQTAAKKILERASHPRGSTWKVCYCRRHLLSFVNQVDVMLSDELKRAYFKNLMACGSVWTCPVCAFNVTRGRKQEVEAAVNVHKAAGGFLYMMTYTFSHSSQDSLRGLLGDSNQVFGLRGALRRLRNSRKYKKLCESFGLVGFIRNLEVTHSYFNGWHPHIHELWLCTRQLVRAELREFRNCLFKLWYEACKQSGLALPNRKHGVNVVEAHSPAEYLQKWGHEQKWGVSAELTRSHVKRSKDRIGFTPFDFLRRVAEGNYNSDYYARLFLEFATEFYGARQCFWTKGLKQAFGIGEVSDEELAEREEQSVELIATISRDVWKRVLCQSSDVRPVILKLAETGGKLAVEEFLAGLF